MKVLQRVLLFGVLVVFGAGCVSSRSGKVYSRDEARKIHTMETGTVEAVADVAIEGTKSGMGTVVGGVAGGVLGSTVGKGSGAKIGAVVGALAGAAAGALTEEKTTRKTALEITVKLDGGKTIIIVQEADVAFAAGDRVRAVTGPDGTVRIRPLVEQ